MAAAVRDSPPDVDVILPTHRGLRWVDEAIASVLAQTHSALRLFVVDDASGDGTFAHVCERWRDDERVTALSLETSQRAAGARMQAIDAGQGEWLAFIDQDDRWHPEKLDWQLACATAAPGVDAVHTDCEHVDESGLRIPSGAQRENAARAAVAWDTLDRDGLTLACFRANRIRLASALVRRSAFEAVEGFDATLFGGEDWDFWVRFASAGHRIAHLPEALLERRIHPQATSAARRTERLEGLYRACDLAVAREPLLAAVEGERIEALVRREIESVGGAAARRRLRERRPCLSARARWRLLAASLVVGLLPQRRRAALAPHVQS